MARQLSLVAWLLCAAAVTVEGSDETLRWQELTKAAEEADAARGQPFMPPPAVEWYTVTIANVSVGYMTTQAAVGEDSASTVEIMDVQVSRGTDTSRMAFQTVFDEHPLEAAAPESAGDHWASGGVRVMAYDQRFAASVVKMNASFTGSAVSLTSDNGEKEHTSELELPSEPWLGRLRARLEFTRRCRAGETDITVQTMRPELGPRLVNLTSTFTGLAHVWDGSERVLSSVWDVQITGVPVNMSEAYAVDGPLRCYRMLHMGLDMPFGYLLATLSSEEAALKAAEDDPDRKLPELVYTMFVPLSRPIPDVYEARQIEIVVKVKGSKGPASLELPTSGYQLVHPSRDSDAQHMRVTIDLQAPQPATADEIDEPEFRQPSAMVDSSDEVVVAMAYQVDAHLAAAH